MSESLQITREGRVLHLALSRPERRNALNMDLCSALGAALEEAEGDAGVGAVLLSGNGKSFCAGMDLHEVLSTTAGDVNEVHERIFTAGIRMTKPLIAAVHGAALAGGTGLAANCHIVVAADDATFGLTEIRIGLWPFVIFRTVVAALGQRRATRRVTAIRAGLSSATRAAKAGKKPAIWPAKCATFSMVTRTPPSKMRGKRFC
jgi:enoyl-CoA hydratase/carnithine racemase